MGSRVVGAGEPPPPYDPVDGTPLPPSGHPQLVRPPDLRRSHRRRQRDEGARPLGARSPRTFLQFAASEAPSRPVPTSSIPPPPLCNRAPKRRSTAGPQGPRVSKGTAPRTAAALARRTCRRTRAARTHCDRSSGSACSTSPQPGLVCSRRREGLARTPTRAAADGRFSERRSQDIDVASAICRGVPTMHARGSEPRPPTRSLTRSRPSHCWASSLAQRRLRRRRTP